MVVLVPLLELLELLLLDDVLEDAGGTAGCKVQAARSMDATKSRESKVDNFFIQTSKYVRMCLWGFMSIHNLSV